MVTMQHSARNLKLNDEQVDFLGHKIATLEKFDPYLELVRVEIILEPNPARGNKNYKCSLDADTKGKHHRAEAKGYNVESAFKEAFESFKRAVRKYHEQRVEH